MTITGWPAVTICTVAEWLGFPACMRSDYLPDDGIIRWSEWRLSWQRDDDLKIMPWSPPWR